MTGRLKQAMRLITGSFLWLVVLVPILGVSAYSLYFIGRHLGAPWFVAGAISTCFDGVALLSARYSVSYAQAGLSGSFPRTVVRLFAIAAAFLQTLHARIGKEPAGSWILWACLPIGAVLVYEIHIRWERRRALAKAGSVYPSPLPAFGFMTWILFPLSTLNQLRDIVEARRTALRAAALTVVDDFARETAKLRNTRERQEQQPASAEVTAPEVMEQHRQRRQARPPGTSAKAHSPKRHIRTWARNHPEYKDKVGTHARIPGHIVDAYYQAHPHEEAGGSG